jgi:hypothetical protein
LSLENKTTKNQANCCSVLLCSKPSDLPKNTSISTFCFCTHGIDWISIQRKEIVYFIVSIQHLIQQQAFILLGIITKLKFINLSTAMRRWCTVSKLPRCLSSMQNWFTVLSMILVFWITLFFHKSISAYVMDRLKELHLPWMNV